MRQHGFAPLFLLPLVLVGLIAVYLIYAYTGSILHQPEPQPQPQKQVQPSLAPSPESTSSATTDQAGNSVSEDINPQQAAMIKPLPPSRVLVNQINKSVLISWQGTGEDVCYFVYRKTPVDAEWQSLPILKGVCGNKGNFGYTDTFIQSGVTYIYGVAAVNNYNGKSDITESTPIATR